jgi:hypothetical protein
MTGISPKIILPPGRAGLLHASGPDVKSLFSPTPEIIKNNWRTIIYCFIRLPSISIKPDGSADGKKFF